MQPNQLMTVPPQRELRRRLHPQPVPPKREGSGWSQHYPPGQHGGDCQSDLWDEGEARYSSSHRSARRFFEARAGCAASSNILWQLWLCSFVRLTNSLPHALRTVGGKKTTGRPPVRVVRPCREARSAQPTRTCTALTAASPAHQSLRLLREYYLLSQRPIPSMRKTNGRSMFRHDSATTSPRRRPQVTRRWILSQVHRNPTGSTQRLDPTLGKTEGFCTHSSPARRGWKLFALIPTMLLHKPQGTGKVSRDEFAKRVDDFFQGRWAELLNAARGSCAIQRPRTEEAEVEKRGRFSPKSKWAKFREPGKR